MKKIFVLGLMLVLMLALAACGKKSEPTFIDKTEVKEDKAQFKEEIKLNETNDKQGQDKKEDKKQAKETKPKTEKKEEPVKPTSAYDTIDNKKFGWGMKRNPHAAPDVSASASAVLKKNNGYYLGDTSRKVIYLTFDEGYENGYTPKILDTLKANNVHAAFFVTGPYVKQQGALIDRMLKEGHIVGNHTINHPSLPETTPEKLEQEVLGLDRMFYDKYKINLKYMRPPKGEYSERVLTQLKDLGHKTIMWSFAYDDFYVDKQKGTDYAYKMIMDNLHNGEIMLLHAVSKDNADVLDRVLKDIKAQGFEFKSLDALS